MGKVILYKAFLINGKKYKQNLNRYDLEMLIDLNVLEVFG